MHSKSLCWLVLVGELLSSRPTKADIAIGTPAPAPKNIILADLGLHVVGLGYERRLRPYLAVQMVAEWYVPWTQNLHSPPLVVSGLALRSRLFFHPFGDVPNGLWISPVSTWGYGQADTDKGRRWGPMWSFGVSVGYAGTVARHLHLSAGLGLQYNAGTFGGSAAPSYAGWAPIIDATIGYAF